MTHTRWIAAFSAVALLVLFGTEALPAQEGPLLRTTLRDRTLAPNKAFDLGRYEPPRITGLASADVPPITLAAARGTAFRLEAGLRAGDFGPAVEALRAASDLLEALDDLSEAPDGLYRALDAYNRLVASGPDALFRDAQGRLLSTLRSALLELEAIALGASRSDDAWAHLGQAPGVSARSPYMVPDDEVLGTAPEWAQGPGAGSSEPDRAVYLIAFTEELRPQTTDRWELPGMAASNPHAFGADFGQFWASASAQPRVRHRTRDPGGAFGVGLGLGNGERYLGLHAAAMSFSSRSGVGDRGAVDVQLHRTIAGAFAIAAGWESAVHWGGDFTENDSGSNRYVVVSGWFTLRPEEEPFSAVMLSVGVGDGRFQSERAFIQDEEGVGVFGSVGVRVWPPGALILEWTGQDLMIATSITPVKARRIAGVIGLADVTGRAGDGVRLVAGGSVGYDFMWW